MKAIAPFVAGLAMVSIAWAAPPAGPVRTIVQRTDALPGQEAVMGTLEAPADALIAAHRHHGVEMGLVIAGKVELTILGQAPRIVAAGETFNVPAETIHSGRVIEGPLTIVSTWVVDKGRPLAE